MRAVKVFAAFVFLAPLQTKGQNSGDQPEAVAQKFFQAESDERWSDAARLLDLTAFERVRDHFLSSARNFHSFAGLTVDRLLQMHPDMPRDVAEYQVKQEQEQWQNFDPVGQDFARVTSIDSLAALPIEEAAARWLEAKGPRWQFARQRKAESLHPQRFGVCHAPPDLPPGQPYGETVMILGVARGVSDSVSYVVFDPVPFFTRRSAARAARAERPESGLSPHALALQRIGGNWRIEPVHDLPGPNGASGSYSVCIADSSERATSQRK